MANDTYFERVDDDRVVLVSLHPAGELRQVLTLDEAAAIQRGECVLPESCAPVLITRAELEAEVAEFRERLEETRQRMVELGHRFDARMARAIAELERELHESEGHR